MSIQDLGPLDWRIAITDGQGRPTPEFQRRWTLQRSNNSQIGSVGGMDGQVQFNNDGVLGGFTLNGDGTVVTDTGHLTITKTNGTPFARSATIDTTNASNVTSGVLGSSQGGAGSINGILQANGAGVVSAYTLPIVIGFILNTGIVGINVGPELIAPRTSSFSKCLVVTKASDASVPLTFRIRQNGADIFTSDPTIVAGTAGSTISTFTNFTSSPLVVNANDLFTIDVTSGTANWQATIQLE